VKYKIPLKQKWTILGFGDRNASQSVYHSLPYDVKNHYTLSLNEERGKDTSIFSKRTEENPDLD
jgi:hypothetical protein